MKYIYYTLFLLLVINSNIIAQIKTSTLNINLNEPNEYSISIDNDTNKIKRLTFKSRHLLAVKLINGNPYKYTYSIDKKNINLFVDQNFTIIDSVGKIITGSENEINKVSETNNPLIQPPGTSEYLTSQNQLMIELEKYKTKQGDSSNIKTLNAKIKDICSKYILKSNHAKNFIDTVKFKYNTKTIKTNKICDLPSDSINSENAIEAMAIAYNDLNTDLIIYTTKLANVETIDESEFKIIRENYYAHYLQLQNSFRLIFEESKQFKINSDKQKKNLDEIKKTSAKINIDLSKLNSINFSNFLLPIDINGKNIDAVQFTIRKSLKSNPNIAPEEATYNVWVNGGLKFDVSGGLFITSLMDKEYETKNTKTTSDSQVIYQVNHGMYDFGFGSLLNVSIRGGSWVRPTLSFGALFTTNQKFQILLGGGLIMGKEERIILHGGLTMGRVKTIADNFTANGTVAYSLGQNGSVPTQDRFTFGHFLGLTYNLSKTKKMVDGIK